LKFAGLAFQYSELSGSALSKPSACFGKVATFASFRENNFRYRDAGRNIEARWTGAGRLMHKAEFRNEVLHWELLQLGSDVSVQKNGEPRLLGLGYGERLILRETPWRLGIRKLSWGRYLSERAFIMWLIADGELPIRYGIVGQESRSDVSLRENEVIVGDVALQLQHEVRAISDGDVLQHRHPSLSYLPIKLFGEKLKLTQSKAIYACTLYSHGQYVETGHAIAETVRFGRS
jgi:hypothetical protein